jgi:hypothetical protein
MTWMANGRERQTGEPGQQMTDRQLAGNDNGGEWGMGDSWAQQMVQMTIGREPQTGGTRPTNNR